MTTGELKRCRIIGIIDAGGANGSFDMINRFTIAVVGMAAVAAFPALHAVNTETACMSSDQEAQSLSIVHPPYPYAARLFCIEGYGKYEFTINPDGSTSSIKAIASEPEGAFEAAGEVIRFWKFEPRCVDGEPVARQAVQNIEFRLDQDDYRNCPENLPEDLLDVQVALFTLYQQTDAAVRNQSSPLTPMPVESALEEPFASIERAHRRHLNDLLALEREWRMYPPWTANRLIGPDILSTEQGFWNARVALDALETGRNELYWKSPTIVKSLRQELADVAAREDVTPKVYEALLAGDLRQPEGGITPNHDMMALEASVFSAHRELLDWLELHSHEWEVVDGEFRFASDGLKQTYRRRIDEIKELWQTWDKEFSTPREIYWSGF